MRLDTISCQSWRRNSRIETLGLMGTHDAELQVRGKAMADKAGDLLDLFHDVLLTARLDDRARFRQVQLLFSLTLHAFSSLIMHGDLCPARVLIAMSTRQDWERFADVFYHSLVN